MKSVTENYLLCRTLEEPCRRIFLCTIALNIFSSYETSHDINLGTTAVCGNILFRLLVLLTAFVCSIVLVCVRTGCPGLSSTGYLCCS